MPRPVTSLGIWAVSGLDLKVYGIKANGQELSNEILDDARTFASDEMPGLVMAQGDSNGLGFVIVHPGELGVSTLLHWWIQGSVLCQHIRRRPYASEDPMNMVNRSVVACVWELCVINAEQEVWRDTMMSADPDPKAYLATRPALHEA